MKNNVILSIKPEHAHEIFITKKKTVEFRKVCFKLPIDRVYVYCSSPMMVICGYFTVKEIIEGTPETIYNKCGKEGLATLDGLKEYFSKRNYGYGIIMDKIVMFKYPIYPNEVIKDFTAPQNYMFIHFDIR